jgi:hypothetical protein
MIYIILLLIPVIIAVTGFIVFKAVQLGLRWQIETKQEQMPTMETPKIPNPLAPFVEARQEKEVASVFYEWTEGAKER